MRTGIRSFMVLTIVCAVLSACSGTSGGAVTATSNSSSIPEAEVILKATLPSPLPENTGLSVELLDEVTGLAFHPTRYQMQSIDPLSYFVRMVVPIGAVLKYRYVKMAEIPTPEYSSSNQPIRYRLASVTGPAVISDTIAGWIDSPFGGATGTLQGQIISSGNVPVPGLMVSIDGLSTITASDGTFEIEKIPVGEHTLVAYSLDGAYEVFQQGAIIANNALTPAVFQVAPSPIVNVTFAVTVPDGDYNKVPIRIMGSLYQFGNTFSDQDGGFSTMAERAPTLVQISAHEFALTIQLPVGTYLEYKYSLGDGFWNAELNEDGSFKLRKVIIPSTDVTYQDTVVTWSTPGYGPITYTVSVPTVTPPNDYVSIQFNPFTWTNPIPMWPLGNNQWCYTLYSPIDYLDQVSYRFCRNDLCGVADDIATVGPNPSAPSFSPSNTSQSLNSVVASWNWLSSYTLPSLTDTVAAKDPNFIKGLQMAPVDLTYLPKDISAIYPEIAQKGTNWIFLSPTWHVTSIDPPRFSAVPGFDALWIDLGRQIDSASQNGLQVAVYPHLMYKTSLVDFWQKATCDDAWWQAMFAQYRRYIIDFVDAAAQNNASAVVIGGADALAFIPNGVYPDGSASNPPSWLSDQWVTLLSDIRARYTGRIIWAIPYPLGADNVPSFLDQVDAILVEFEAPLSQSGDTTIDALTTVFLTDLQQFAQPLQQDFGKPVIMGVAYPSADGAETGCVQVNGACVPFDQLAQPSPLLLSLSVDLQEQADIYTAALRAVNQTDWINGFISMGYFSAAELQDSGLSVHGKPAEDVLEFYFLNW
jgi:hypothetical protein